MKKLNKIDIFSKFKLIVVLSIVCAVLAVNFFINMNTKRLATVSAQQKNAQIQTQQDENSLETKRRMDFIDEVAEPSSAQEREERKEKNRRYDKKNGFKPSKKLTELPNGTGALGPISESPELPSLPVIQSDAIVLGTVTEAQPYMTESQYLIYTELTFEIEGVLKGNELQNISEGSSIKIDHEAGALRLANGKKVFYDATGRGSLPRVKKRYLLFLKRINDGHDLSIVGGYELLNGKVFPLKTTNVFSPSMGTKRIMPFAATDETVFLQIVRDAIANPNNISNGGEN